MNTLPSATEARLPLAPLTKREIADRLNHRARIIAITAADGDPVSPAQVADFRLYYQADNVRAGWCRDHVGAGPAHCPTPSPAPVRAA